MRYFIKLQYKGTNYHGWQKQKNAITVQEELEKALKILFNLSIETTGCGRTDTGVHASNFYAHIDLPKEINASETVCGLNGILKQDIVIQQILAVKDTAHARFDAINRTYNYYIHQEKSPFKTEISTYFNRQLNIDLMNEAADKLLDYNDFSCFSKHHTQTFTNNCIIEFAEWTQNNLDVIFTITANRFLRNMVRAIVGTLLEVGLEKISIPDFENIILSKKRSNAGKSVAASGLFLSNVSYPNSIFI